MAAASRLDRSVDARFVDCPYGERINVTSRYLWDVRLPVPGLNLTRLKGIHLLFRLSSVVNGGCTRHERMKPERGNGAIYFLASKKKKRTSGLITLKKLGGVAFKIYQ